MKHTPLTIKAGSGSTPITRAQLAALIGERAVEEGECRFAMEQLGTIRGLTVTATWRPGPTHEYVDTYTLHGIRTLSRARESGYNMDGTVSIGGRKFSAFTSSILFELECGKLVNVEVLQLTPMTTKITPESGPTKKTFKHGFALRFASAQVFYTEKPDANGVKRPRLQVMTIDAYGFQREWTISLRHASSMSNLYWESHAYRHPGRLRVAKISEDVAKRLIARFLDIAERYPTLLFDPSESRSQGFVHFHEALLDGAEPSAKILWRSAWQKP